MFEYYPSKLVLLWWKYKASNKTSDVKLWAVSFTSGGRSIHCAATDQLATIRLMLSSHLRDKLCYYTLIKVNYSNPFKCITL